MKRTTVFLTDELDRMLHEAARRSHRPQAEIVRDALEQYLRAHGRPWPRSVGMGRSPDRAVTSDNVKDWIREEWGRELEQSGETEPAPPAC
jgi:hypothetical protein